MSGIEILKDEHNKMNARWEDGPLYYRVKEYFKKFGRPLTNIRSCINKPYITALLTLARLGLPITSTLIAFMTGQRIERSLGILEHYCSLGMLEPQDPLKNVHGPFLRKFKLQSDFIEFVYRPLRETQQEVEQ